MKRPSLKFDKQAILGFLLKHAEKLIVGLVGLIGLVLLWNGINALRIKSVRSTETPEAVTQLSAATVQHIDAVQKPPADTVRKGGELALAIDRLASPRDLAPLPVLGIPGWWPTNDAPAFYDDARYFRPGRQT